MGEDWRAKDTRLARGPLPLDEALDVCRQIAEGLEVAHEAGVVHRDLKPANVRITPEGVHRLLDFGLAKPMQVKAGRAGTGTAESDSFLMTEEGLVLGTPTYMSPEQARGRAVDRRTDIWAFGCVLFECLTGRRAFGGDAVTDILAAIVSEELDWDALPPLTTHDVQFAAFDESEEQICFCSASTKSDVEVLEGWSVGWQAGPEPTLGVPRKHFELEGSIRVSDFDPHRERFLAFERQVDEGCHILLKTGWVDAQRAR